MICLRFWRSAGLGVAVTLATAAGIVLSPAGVVAAPQSGTSPHIDLPVSWRVTRTQMRSSGPVTTVLAYRDLWRLVMAPPPAGLFLESDRVRVPVTRMDATAAGQLPTRLVVAAEDFALLIGQHRGLGAISENSSLSEDPEASTLSLTDALVVLSLVATSQAGAVNEISLIQAEKDRLIVELEFGKLAVASPTR